MEPDLCRLNGGCIAFDAGVPLFQRPVSHGHELLSFHAFDLQNEKGRSRFSEAAFRWRDVARVMGMSRL